MPSSYLVGALDVDCSDQVPVRVLHVLEADVAEDAGIVDQDVDAAESVNGRLDDLVTELDTVVVCHGLAAGLLDLVDDNIGGLPTESECARPLGLGRYIPWCRCPLP